MALRRIHGVSAAVCAALPFVLAALLNLVRPDLMQGLTESLFFGQVVSGVALLSGLGAGSLLLGWWLVDRFVPGSRPRTRKGFNAAVAVLSGLLFIFPSLVLVLYAPVVTALISGDQEAPSPFPAAAALSASGDEGWTQEELAERVRRRTSSPKGAP